MFHMPCTHRCEPDLYPKRKHTHLPAILLKLPVAVVERTDLPRLQPTRDAVEVECVLCLLARSLPHCVQTHVADAPGNSALLARSGRLVCLALDAQVHNMVPANGAVVDDNVPRPKSYGVPLPAR
jgi:hypothetical protein